MTARQLDTTCSRQSLADLRALTVAELLEHIRRLARTGHGDYTIAATTRLDVATIRHALSGEPR